MIFSAILVILVSNPNWLVFWYEILKHMFEQAALSTAVLAGEDQKLSGSGAEIDPVSNLKYNKI